jgi:hypothetical protein
LVLNIIRRRFGRTDEINPKGHIGPARRLTRKNGKVHCIKTTNWRGRRKSGSRSRHDGQNPNQAEGQNRKAKESLLSHNAKVV